MIELQEFLYDLNEWALKTFNVTVPQPKLHHLLDEVKELITALNDGSKKEDIEMEFADCFILLFNAATVYGLTSGDILALMKEKMIINKSRTWTKKNELGVSYHIKKEREPGDEHDQFS